MKNKMRSEITYPFWSSFVVFCPVLGRMTDISFEPFMCLDLVLRTLADILVQILLKIHFSRLLPAGERPSFYSVEQ